MTPKSKILWALTLVAGVIYGVGCSTGTVPNTSVPIPNISTPTKEAEPTLESPVVSTPLPNQVVLPVNRQVAPADIQAQVRWFDGGAGGGRWVGCQFLAPKNSSNIQIAPVKNPNDQLLYEGERVAVCAWNLPPQSQFTWTLETPRGDVIENTGSSGIDGIAEFWPNFSYLHGLYGVHIVSSDTVLETQFEILPAKLPKIWAVGGLEVGKTIIVYYAGFEPQEVITTVWYAISSFDQADYVTSWETTIDESGHASETVFVPENACIPEYSILAVQSQRITGKRWEIMGDGFGLDLLASAIEEIGATANCPTETWDDGQQVIDNSSRFLKQVDMGTIGDGETESGALGAVFEAHNWTFEAQEGKTVSVRVTYLHNPFPADRVSIIDPTGRLVYECSNVFYGCMDEIEYEPQMSGDYVIRLDMFNEGDGTYSISVRSLPGESDITQYEIVVDDSSEGLLLGGPSQGWRVAPFGYQGSTHWTYCTDEGASNWAKWVPHLPVGGDYEVFVFVPEHNAGTIQAKYRVFHNGIDSEAVVRQADYANTWVSIGDFWFAANGDEYVYLDDNTGEPRRSNITIAFDAVKFVYVP